LISPLVLIGGLALAGGGFELADRHIAGLAVWLLVAALLALGGAGRAGLARPLYLVTGLTGAVAVFSALSSLWSGSAELSVTEADRMLVYLGVLVAAFLIAQTAARRQRFAEGLGIALFFLALLGLGARLLPHLISVAEGLGSGPRLRYPLGYSNANGVAFSLGAALAIWMSRNAREAALRWGAVAALPALLLALYFTYSRGGLIALVIGCGCFLALSHDRFWLLLTLAAGALGALPTVLVVQGHQSIADNLDNGAAAGQGVLVLFVLLAGIALALLLSAGQQRLERRDGGLTGRALALSRDPKVLRGIALAGAVIAIGVAVAIGGRAWDQFSSSDLYFPDNPSQHFGDLNGAGRHDFWRVAIDSFEEEPVLGTGAGTYLFSWERLRSMPIRVLDAHSLYLEAFSELGLFGGFLVLAMVGAILWTGFAAWRAARGAERELFAVLLAVALAYAVGVAIDWYWEIAASGAVFFAAAGAIVAGRCSQLVRGQPTRNGAGSRSGIGLAIGGLAVAWISALALVGPLLVDREIDQSRAAAADGDIAQAEQHARNARSIEPWAASPYAQLALIAEFDAQHGVAIERLDQAIDREDGNWTYYYLRARNEHAAGRIEAARRDLAEARRLNPLEKCLSEGWEGC
jgi:O-Antigen ligase